MRAFMVAHADDAAYLLGVCLVGIGVYRVSPVATWFYAGAVLLAIGAMLTLAGARRAE